MAISNGRKNQSFFIFRERKRTQPARFERVATGCVFVLLEVIINEKRFN